MRRKDVYVYVVCKIIVNNYTEGVSHLQRKR